MWEGSIVHRVHHITEGVSEHIMVGIRVICTMFWEVSAHKGLETVESLGSMCGHVVVINVSRIVHFCVITMVTLW
jgi:hypothetical protein